MITYWIMTKVGQQDWIAHYADVAVAAGHDGWTSAEVEEPLSAFNSRSA